MPTTQAKIKLDWPAFSEESVEASLRALPSKLPELDLQLDLVFTDRPRTPNKSREQAATTQLTQLLKNGGVYTQIEDVWKAYLGRKRDRLLREEIAKWDAIQAPTPLDPSPPSRERLQQVAEEFYADCLACVRGDRDIPPWEEFAYARVPAPPQLQVPPSQARQSWHRAAADQGEAVMTLAVIISMPLNAWLLGLANEAGKDTWLTIKHGFSKLFKIWVPSRQDRRRQPTDIHGNTVQRVSPSHHKIRQMLRWTEGEREYELVDAVIIEDEETDLKIYIPYGLPDLAWQQLADLFLPPAPPGVAQHLEWAGRWQIKIDLRALPLRGIRRPSGFTDALLVWEPAERVWAVHIPDY